MLFVAEFIKQFSPVYANEILIFAARQRARNWQGKMPDCELIN